MSYTLANLVQKRVDQEPPPQFSLPFSLEKDENDASGVLLEGTSRNISLLATPSAPPWTALVEDSLTRDAEPTFFPDELDDTIGLQWLQEVYVSPIKGSQHRKTRSLTRNEPRKRSWPEPSRESSALVQHLFQAGSVIVHRLRSWCKTGYRRLRMNQWTLNESGWLSEPVFDLYKRRLRCNIPIWIERSHQFMQQLRLEAIQWHKQRSWALEGTLTGLLILSSKPLRPQPTARGRGSGAIWRRWQLNWLEERARHQTRYWDERINTLEEALRTAYQRASYWHGELQRIQRHRSECKLRASR